MRRLLILTGVVSLLVVGGIVASQYYFGRPEYALAQAAKAIEAKNLLRFERYVDVESFSKSVVDEIFDVALSNAATEPGSTGWGAIGSILGTGLVESMKPATVRTLKSSISQGVANGTLLSALAEHDSQQEADDAPVVSAITRSGLQPTTFVKFERSQVERNHALVPALFHDTILDTTLSVHIEMRRVDKDWRVVGMKNLTAYMTTIASLRESHLAETNDELLDELASIADVGRIKRREIGSGWLGPDWLYFSCAVTNRSSQRLTAGLVRAELPGSVGEDYLDLVIHKPIEAGRDGEAIRPIEYNMFISWHEKMRSLRLSNLTPKPVFLILESQGREDTLKVFESWDEYASNWTASHPNSN